MATHKRNRSDVFQNNIITTQKLLESPRAKITFNPKMSGHRRSSSLQVNRNQDIQSALSNGNGNKTKQNNRLSINFNNNNINTNQLHKNLMQSPSVQFMQHNTLSNSNNSISINTRKKTSQNDVMYISPMVSLFNKKEGGNGEIFQQKKSAHRRASSLSIKGLDPLELSNHNNNIHSNMYNSKKVSIGKTTAKKGRVSNEDNFSIDEMIDNKHKKLLSEGIITPPDLTSPISSPNTSSFLLNFKKNGNNNNTGKSTNKVINLSLGSPMVNRVHPHHQDGFVHPDLLSTDYDIEEEFEFSFDDDDSSNRNKGRFAPNPFKMISGGDFDFGSPPRYGCISAPTVNYNTYVVSDIEPHEIGEDYFQRKRSNSLNGSQDDLILTESSAFKTFFDDN